MVSQNPNQDTWQDIQQAIPQDIRALVVVPIYNHGRTLRAVVEGVLAVHSSVLVVDDGSTDGGGQDIQDLNVPILRHETNRGKGAAIRTAAKEAMARGYTHMITIDADGQHDPADIPKFLRIIAEHPQAVVVGARDFTAPNIPGSSKFGRKFSNFWLRLQTGVSLSDTQSGFRAYPLFLFGCFTFRENRYSFEVEILVRAAWAGVELREVDIFVHYPPGEERISHFRTFTDNLLISLLNTRLTTRAIIPWPHKKILCKPGVERRMSLLHPIRSLRYLLEHEATPWDLAKGGVMGVLLGASPLIGIHTLLILMVGNYFRLNRYSALAASQLCMPPFVPALCIEMGYYMRHGRFLTEFSLETLGAQVLDRFWEWFLGFWMVGPILALIVGVFILGVAHHLRQQMRKFMK